MVLVGLNESLNCDYSRINKDCVLSIFNIRRLVGFTLQSTESFRQPKSGLILALGSTMFASVVLEEVYTFAEHGDWADYPLMPDYEARCDEVVFYRQLSVFSHVFCGIRGRERRL